MFFNEAFSVFSIILYQIWSLFSRVHATLYSIVHYVGWSVCYHLANFSFFQSFTTVLCVEVIFYVFKVFTV